jgi:hypothetical protein
MVSACWHGFYPVYYFFFFQFYIVEQVSGFLAQLGFFAYIEKQSLLIRQLVNLVVMAFFNYLGINFVLLTFDNMVNFAWSLRLIPPSLIFLMYFIFGKMLAQKKSREKREKSKLEGNPTGKVTTPEKADKVE